MKSKGASRGNHIFRSKAAQKAIATPARRTIRRVGALTGLGTTMTFLPQNLPAPGIKAGLILQESLGITQLSSGMPNSKTFCS